MSNNDKLFSPLYPQDSPTVLLARCLNEAFNRGYTFRFEPLTGSYEAIGHFYNKPDVTIRQIVSWRDHEKEENIIFSYLVCNDIHGYSIEREPIKNNETPA